MVLPGLSATLLDNDSRSLARTTKDEICESYVPTPKKYGHAKYWPFKADGFHINTQTNLCII